MKSKNEPRVRLQYMLCGQTPRKTKYYVETPSWGPLETVVAVGMALAKLNAK